MIPKSKYKSKPGQVSTILVHMNICIEGARKGHLIEIKGQLLIFFKTINLITTNHVKNGIMLQPI